MKIIIMTSAFFVLTLGAFSQTSTFKPELNAGYEHFTFSQQLPDEYSVWGSDYKLTLDSSTKFNGRNSVLLQPSDATKSPFFGAVAYQIPSVFDGDEIELRFLMKLENSQEEPIAFVLQMNGLSVTPLTFANLQEKKSRESADWSIYFVKVPFPTDAGRIYVGAMLYGSGKVWVNDFELLIDGQEIIMIKTCSTCSLRRLVCSMKNKKESI